MKKTMSFMAVIFAAAIVITACSKQKETKADCRKRCEKEVLECPGDVQNMDPMKAQKVLSECSDEYKECLSG